MRSHARLVHAFMCAVFLVSGLASPALAQEGTGEPATTETTFTKPGPPPETPGGICAPWHRCLAWAGLGMAVLFGLAMTAGYLVQSKGFDAVEHKQGNPEGVKVSRE